ncbi:MAG: N-formylglutamate amidohydrolase [Candidatus Eisenbacteria bacterium]
MEKVWTIEQGEGPLVASAIHDGHAARPEVARLLSISEADRLREEDPFTGGWTAIAPTRVIGRRSRFEVDLNRPRSRAVYVNPEDAWGLEVWKETPPDDLVSRSLEEHDAFYDAMRRLLSGIRDRHGRFVVLDLHSYNHRREGPDGPNADETENPAVNLGTGNLDRSVWSGVTDRFLGELRAFDFPGGPLDVRENVKFRGGNFSRWVNETFPGEGCSLAIEFKKFFMDEWTGEADRALVDAIGAALRQAARGVIEELETG